jgi:hypothetical protein
MNGSDAHPASVVNKIIWSCYVTLDSLISSPVLAGWASDPFMLPPCTLDPLAQQPRSLALGFPLARHSLSRKPVRIQFTGIRMAAESAAVALAGAGSIKQPSPVQVVDLTGCPCRRVLHHINYALACTPARVSEPQDKQEQDCWCWCWCVTLLFGRNGRGCHAALYSPGPGTGDYKRKRRKKWQKVG